MSETLEYTVARLERIIRGESGWQKGLAQRVPEIEAEMAAIKSEVQGVRGSLNELVAMEKQRKVDGMEEKKARDKWIKGIVAGIAVVAAGQIFSTVNDLLLAIGGGG